MKYLLLIYTNEQADQQATPEQQQEIFQAYGSYTQSIQEQGIMLGGEALQPTTTATTVQVRDGKTITTDGPFAETKELKHNIAKAAQKLLFISRLLLTYFILATADGIACN